MTHRTIVEEKIFTWLTHLQLLEVDEEQVKHNSNTGNVEIGDEVVYRHFTCGVLAKHLLLTLASLNHAGAEVAKKLSLVSDHTSESAKLNNWTRLTEILPVFPGMAVSKGTVDAIMGGNDKVPIDIINQIYSVCQVKGKTIHLPKDMTKGGQPVSANTSKLPLKTTSSLDNSKSKILPVDQDNKEEVVKSRMDLSPYYGVEQTQQLANFTEKSGFGQCSNCLEFISLAMSKETGVKPLQVVPLFNENNKNWSTLITKGKNNDQKVIVRFYTHILSNITTLQHLIKIEDDDVGLTFSLEALKSGFMSKDLRVATLTCQVFAKLLKDLADRNHLESAWNFFKKVYGGFLGVISCFDTFGDSILPNIFLVLREIGKYDLLKMFKEEFRRMIPDPTHYGSFMCHILTLYASDDKYIKELLDDAVVDHLVKFATHGLEFPSTSDRDDNLMSMIGKL